MPKIVLPIAFLIVTSVCIHFYLLRDYPYVATFDQVRDGGLNAQEIVQGTLINIFGYGRYASHGTIIPTITTIFYLLFHNSVYTYRVPAAFIGSIDTMLLYLLVSRVANKRAGFWASLTLLSLPLHLYYARTEIVVIWSEFFTILDLLLLETLLRKPSVKTYVLLGITLGFGSGFHTSVRTVSLVIGLLVICYSLFQGVCKRRKVFLVNALSLVLSYFIGFGPRIFYTTPNIFFQMRSFTPPHQSLSIIAYRYLLSLLVYIFKPTISVHYPDYKPLLTLFPAIFFFLGFAISICRKNFFLFILILLAFILPFTNSAITDLVNADNRLLPLLVIAAIFVGIGMGALQDLVGISTNLLGFKQLVIAMFICYNVLQILLFFYEQPANRRYAPIDYLSMHTIYAIQNDADYTHLHSLCLFVSQNQLAYFYQEYVQEQYEYFLPGKLITVIPYYSVQNNQIVISASCNETGIEQRSKVLTFCSTREPFTCSLYPSILTVFLENPQKTSKMPASMYMGSFVILPLPVAIP